LNSTGLLPVVTKPPPIGGRAGKMILACSVSVKKDRDALKIVPGRITASF